MTHHHPHEHEHEHEHSHEHEHAHQHSAEDLSYAGQGSVLLDIGGDVGALIVHMPEALAGQEIEICPAGADRYAERRAHVAVLGRPIGIDLAYTAVFGELNEGHYDLYRKPDGPVRLTASVTGGEIREVRWPVE